MLDIYYSGFDTFDLTRGQIANIESQLGHKMLRHVLSNIYFRGKELPEIALTSAGKPYLSDNSLEFNISHSHGKVVLAVSDTPVGIDIENEHRILSPIICRRFFAKEQATPEEWTMFESYCKLTGEGMFGVTFPPSQEVYFKSYHDIPGYVISVCSEKQDFPASIITIVP